MDNQYMDFEHIENFINFQYNLGCYYYYFEKNMLQALNYFQLAANNNHIKAKIIINSNDFQYNLGWYYYNNKNILQALYYFQLAANNNHIKAKKMMDILTPIMKIYKKENDK